MEKVKSGYSWDKTSTSKPSAADLTDRIQKKAREIWERKGCPEGQDIENWLEAEKLVKSGKA